MESSVVPQQPWWLRDKLSGDRFFREYYEPDGKVGTTQPSFTHFTGAPCRVLIVPQFRGWFTLG